MAKTFIVFGAVFSFLSIKFFGFNLKAYLGSVQTRDKYIYILYNLCGRIDE